MVGNETNILEELYLNAPVNNAESEFSTEREETTPQTTDSKVNNEADKDASDKKEKKQKRAEKELYYYAKDKKEIVLETIVIILFALSALLNAYTNWANSIYTKEEDRLVSESMQLKNESNAEYANANSLYSADMNTYNSTMNMVISISIDKMVDQYLAESDTIDTQKIDDITGVLAVEMLTMNMANNSFSQIFVDNFADYFTSESQYQMSPFANEKFQNLYFEKSEKLTKESEAALAAAEEYGKHASSYHFVSLLFSALMFLLGINKAFKGFRNCLIVFCVAMVLFIPAIIFMFTLPAPFALAF
ncbi:MAG: hypothetical protein MJ105_02515 [Lachnospiraceae bacterium]|nr:hypothetical protein [Lachnospiraceae bacterium]